MKVANPKLTLYAFHLRNNLAQGEEEPVEDVNHLWEQCQQLGQKLDVPRLESLLERLQNSNGKIGITPTRHRISGSKTTTTLRTAHYRRQYRFSRQWNLISSHF